MLFRTFIRQFCLIILGRSWESMHSLILPLMSRSLRCEIYGIVTERMRLIYGHICTCSEGNRVVIWMNDDPS